MNGKCPAVITSPLFSAKILNCRPGLGCATDFEFSDLPVAEVILQLRGDVNAVFK